MKQLRQNLLLQFSLASLVAIGLIASLAVWLLSQSLRSNIINEAVQETQDTLAGRVISQLSPSDLSNPMTGSRYEEFHLFVQESIVSARTARVKLWNSQGTVIYSNDRSQVGQSYDIKAPLAQALIGKPATSISIPKDIENERERLLGTLLEVYVPLSFPGSRQVVGSLEVYQYYAPFAAYIDQANRAVLLAVVPASALFYLVMVSLVARGWRTIRTQQDKLSRNYREIEKLNLSLRNLVVDRQKIVHALLGMGRQVQSLSPGDETSRILVQNIRTLALQAEALSEIAGDPVLRDLLGS